MITDYKIWHRALSTDEVTKVFNRQDVKCGCELCKEKENNKS